MKKIKANWEITQNWQLLFPLIGVLFLGYSTLKIVKLAPSNWFEFLSAKSYMLPFISFIAVFSVLFYLFLKIVLFAIHKLEGKWVVNQRWELIRIFIVFAFTGSSSVIVGRPFIQWIGITKENLHPLFYWILFIFVSLFFYQILLVVFGWLFGQFKFFWNFEKKMLKRFGLSRFLED
jgi:hypothetical protein|tara:strand:+ start:425 stop:955 length:531 start_codon:yes stop_codon:yes gene_type:complete